MTKFQRTTKSIFLPLTGALFLLLTACAGPQIYSTAQHHIMSLEPGDLPSHGLAFITPSTVTGKEQDTQTLAFIFGEVLTEERPDIRYVPLSETLGLLNRSGLTNEYKQMFEDYRHTGIFESGTLRKVGEETGARYLAHLKLASFSQGSRGRWSILGIRMTQTKNASIRLFFQIWDSEDSTIAWEGAEELNYSYDTMSEKEITFRTVVEETAKNLIANLP